jgi:hypothetical protein
MNRYLHGGAALLARLVVMLVLSLTPILSESARAQAPGDPAAATPAEGESSGRPLDGYLGTAVLAFLALFIVGKSARR